MGGMGAFLGGALQGIGAGLAAEGRQRWEDRREMALQQLRGQQAAELASKQHANRKDEIATQAQFDNWKDSQKTERTTASTIATDRAKTDNDIRVVSAREQSDRRLEVLRNNLGIKRDAAKTAADAKAEKDLQAGEIKETFVSGDGYLWVVPKRGAPYQTSAKATERDMYGPRAASPGSGGVLAEVAAGRAGGGQALPAPSAAPRSVMIFDPKTGEFIQAGER